MITEGDFDREMEKVLEARRARAREQRIAIEALEAWEERDQLEGAWGEGLTEEEVEKEIRQARINPLLLTDEEKAQIRKKARETYEARKKAQEEARLRREAKEVEERAQTAEVVSILRAAGIEMQVEACGCCDSPYVRFVHQGRVIVDRGTFNFDTEESDG